MWENIVGSHLTYLEQHEAAVKEKEEALGPRLQGVTRREIEVTERGEDLKKKVGEIEA